MDYTAAGAAWCLPRLIPSPAGKMHLAVRRTIEAYRQSSYDAFSFDMVVAPSKFKDPRNATTYGLGYTGTQLFDFHPLGDADAQHVFVRYVRSTSDMDRTLEIASLPRRGRSLKWHPLLEYLRKLPLTQSPNTRDLRHMNRLDSFNYRLGHQIDWWAANGKSFPFLSLPRELREQIYGCCIGERIEPYPYSGLRNRSGNFAASRVHVKFLLVNKQTSEEVREQIYATTTFQVCLSGLLERLLGNRNFPLHRLRKLTLLFLRLNDYFEFFGLATVDPDSTDDDEEPEVKWRHSVVRCAFEEMDLRSLTLFMPLIRKQWGDVTAPWGTQMFHPFICQRKSVELVLEAAWPFIKGQPITLTGSIGRKQKKAWEHRARIAHQERIQERMTPKSVNGENGDEEDNLDEEDEDEDDGGVMLDGSGAARGNVSTTTPKVYEEVEDDSAEETPYCYRNKHSVQAHFPLDCDCHVSCGTGWCSDDESEQPTED